jgi:hypothetical protein
LREGYTPLVVKERVRDGVKRKEIKAFLLEHNGIATGGQAVTRDP